VELRCPALPEVQICDVAEANERFLLFGFVGRQLPVEQVALATELRGRVITCPGDDDAVCRIVPSVAGEFTDCLF
jgi:hypothetical protein